MDKFIPRSKQKALDPKTFVVLLTIFSQSFRHIQLGSKVAKLLGVV